MERIQLIGFVLELGILVAAVYIYLYTAGIIRPQDRAAKARQDNFMKNYGRLMRPLLLLLMAILTMNVILRFVG